jgi:hypothetical protein
MHLANQSINRPHATAHPELRPMINYFRHNTCMRKHAYIFNQNSCPTFNQCMNMRKTNYGGQMGEE